MAPEVSRPAELTSWKEIAAYLGVGVRTAQVWEHERGLPVRRLPGARGPVAAAISDLEEWKRSRGNPGPEAPTAPRNASRSRPPLLGVVRRHRWLALAVTLCALVALAAFFRPSHRALVRAKVVQNSLRAFDDRGREAWSRDFSSLAAIVDDQSVWVGDLDGDARNEVLLRYTVAEPKGASVLACYDSAGHERWRFTPGRSVRTATYTFDPPFRVATYLVVTLGRTPHIIVASEHFLYFPAQIAVLDANGHLLREYWHPGHLSQLATVEVNGALILLAGGVNNARKQATLVALDPQSMAGASREADTNYQIQGFAAPRERARLFFARSCINEQLEAFNFIARLLTPEDYVIAEVQHHINEGGDATIFYHLNFDLSLRTMMIGTSFELTHQRLAAQHVLDHELHEGEIATLRTIGRE